MANPLTDTKTCTVPNVLHAAEGNSYLQVVTPLAHTQCNTVGILPLCLRSNEVEPDEITLRLLLEESARMGPLAERRLEGKTFARVDYITDHEQHKVTRQWEQAP